MPPPPLTVSQSETFQPFRLALFIYKGKLFMTMIIWIDWQARSYSFYKLLSTWCLPAYHHLPTINTTIICFSRWKFKSKEGQVTEPQDILPLGEHLPCLHSHSPWHQFLPFPIGHSSQVSARCWPQFTVSVPAVKFVLSFNWIFFLVLK